MLWAGSSRRRFCVGPTGGDVVEAGESYQDFEECSTRRGCWVFPRPPIDLASSASNLPLYIASQGKSKEARQLHERSLDMRERALGPDHPDVALTINNLAVLFFKQVRILEFSKKVFGVLDSTFCRVRPCRSVNCLIRGHGCRGASWHSQTVNDESLDPGHPNVCAPHSISGRSC